MPAQPPGGVGMFGVGCLASVPLAAAETHSTVPAYASTNSCLVYAFPSAGSTRRSGCRRRTELSANLTEGNLCRTARKGISLRQKGHESARKGICLWQKGRESARKGICLLQKGRESARKGIGLWQKGRESARKGGAARVGPAVERDAPTVTGRPDRTVGSLFGGVRQEPKTVTCRLAVRRSPSRHRATTCHLVPDVEVDDLAVLLKKTPTIYHESAGTDRTTELTEDSWPASRVFLRRSAT